VETDQVIPRIIELFDSACISQFESMGCDIKSVDGTSISTERQNDSKLVTSYIEAASEDLSVKLFLTSPRALLTETMPVVEDLSLSTEQFQEDWNLELANRFLGRLKNKLVDHGCSLQMGIPLKCLDAEARKEMQFDAEKVVRFFQVSLWSAGVLKSDVIDCCLFIRLMSEGLALEDHEDEDEAWFDESELEHL